MSIYDNFRAPQYVDFAGINNGDINTDTSSFFDRDTDVSSTPSAVGSIFRGSSVSSFNGTFSDGDATLTPSKFSTSSCKVPEDRTNQTQTAQTASLHIKLIPASPLTQSSKSEIFFGNESPTIETFNIPSHRVSTPMVQGAIAKVETKVSCASPQRQSIRATESSTSASKVFSPLGKTPKTTGDLSGNVMGASRKSRCSGVAPSHHRRSRSATSPKSTEEILHDAIRTLSISSSNKKPQSGVANDVDQLSSPAQLVPTLKTIPCTKLQSSGKEVVGPKRKLSPPPKNTTDYGQQPAKYISMAEQVAQIQKQTPKRFRSVPSNAALKKGIQSKVARNLSTQPKTAPVSSGGSGPMPSVPQKKLKGHEGPSSENKGVKVARWPQAKVEPFVLTNYKKKDLPKTVFNFEQKESVLLRDRKTPCKRVRQTTMIQPFSFDKRDQELLQRKINRVTGVETQSHCCQTKGRRRSRSQGDENCQKKDPLVHHARLPTVLHRPPFVPQKKPQKVTRPIDFCLNTEKRAKEREEFDELVKLKEMERLTMLNKLQEERRLQEEKEILQLRKELVHKARPVPAFTPFTVHPSNAPLTDPSTPNFLRHSKPSHEPRSSADAMES